MDQETLLEEIELFLVKHRMSTTTFGVHAVNSGNLLYEVRLGRKMKPETMQRIKAWMESYQSEQDDCTAETLKKIRDTGYVMVQFGGGSYSINLPSGVPISKLIFERLISEGSIRPGGDSMFGTISQTYVPVDG